jgi:hypothetical protein
MAAAAASPPKADSRPAPTNSIIKAEIFECDDSCKRGSPCSAFVIALTPPVKTKPGPLPTRIGFLGCTDARLRHTDTRLPDDDLTPFSDDFA